MSVKERLASMLDKSAFAFNVIHEIGLFQGRLGFSRAIVLLEDGCVEFSNIHGIVQLRFRQGELIAQAEEIRRILEREGLLGTA